MENVTNIDYKHAKRVFREFKTNIFTNIDYKHAKRVFREFNTNNLGDYHDLYVQSDTLLLADVFEKFRNICLEIHGLDPAYFLSLPGFAWQTCLQLTGVELELLTDPNMLLMVEERIRD